MDNKKVKEKKTNEPSALTKAVIGAVDRVAGSIEKINSKAEKGKSFIPESIILAIYAIAHIVIGRFHEPRYDEAVAWQIAKCCSFKKMIFDIPHYEGHPPFWHMLLAPFAKLGADYEITLLVISLVFTMAAMYLFLKYSPFPRLVKLCVPLTYYFFYAYGVISRPYCVLMLGFVLISMFYKTRNEKPGRFIWALVLMCAASAYGIIFAGCICIVWVFEIWNKRNFVEFVKNFKDDKRIWYLACLLLFALILIALIIPKGDAYAIKGFDNSITGKVENGLIMKLFYMVFVLPADAVCSSVYNEFASLAAAELTMSMMIGSAVAGSLIWALILIYGWKKKTILLYVIPYSAFVVFCTSVYFYVHHIGLVTLFMLFWFWVSIETESERKLKFKAEDIAIIKNGAIIFIMISIVVALVWNFMSCFNEVKWVYGAGRNEARFIKEHKLNELKIAGEWESHNEPQTKKLIAQDTNIFSFADNLLAYFDTNIIYNFNEGKNDVAYSTHIRSTKEEGINANKRWAEVGIPDVLYQEVRVDLLFDKKVISNDDYALVFIQPVNYIFKLETETTWSTIYLRKDLLEKYGLKEIKMPFLYTRENYKKYLNDNK